MAGTSYAANAHRVLRATCVAIVLSVFGWPAPSDAQEPSTSAYGETHSYDSVRYVFEGGDEAVRESLLLGLVRAWPDAELERASEWYSFENLAAVEERAARGMPHRAGLVLVRIEDDGDGILLMDMRFFSRSSARVSDSGTRDELRGRFTDHFRQAGGHAVAGGSDSSRTGSDGASGMPVGQGVGAHDNATSSRGATNPDYEHLSDASSRPVDWIPRRAGIRFAIGMISDRTEHYRSPSSANPEDQPGIYYPSVRFAFGPSFERARYWERSVAMVYGGGATFSRGVQRDVLDVGGRSYDVVMWRFALYGQAAIMWSNAVRRLRQDRLGISAGAGFVLQVNAGDYVRARSGAGDDDDSISLSSTLYDERHFSADLQLVLRFDLPNDRGPAVAFDFRLAQSLRPIALDYTVNETRLETGIHVGF